MILTIFFALVFGITNTILSILPRGAAPPTDFSIGVQTIASLIRSYDFILPFAALQTCFTVLVYWILFVSAWNFIHWLLEKVPFLNIK